MDKVSLVTAVSLALDSKNAAQPVIALRASMMHRSSNAPRIFDCKQCAPWRLLGGSILNSAIMHVLDRDQPRA